MKSKLKKEFTFGVLAYNQEKEVLYTLNSIKYQIMNYGRDVKCNLIITDDCSKDNTRNSIDLWLENNGSIFNKITKRYNKDNRGTVDNYRFVIRNIKDEPFKIIAADDLISSNDIINTANMIENKEIYNGFRILLEDDNLYMPKNIRILYFWLYNHDLSKKKRLKLFKMGNYISTPQTLYSKSTYEISKANDFNHEFRLFEDNPTWYSMIKNVDGLKIVFDLKTVVLYRISEKSVSNCKEHVNTVFENEMKKLFNTYIKEGGFGDKLYFKSKMKKCKKLFNFSKYVDKLFMIETQIFAILHIKKYRNFNQIVDTTLQVEKKYMDEIINITNCFGK